DPDAVQFEHSPGGIPATGVMFAVYGPLAAAGTLRTFCPPTVTVTTQNAGMSSLCLMVSCDRPVPQSIVMVPMRPTNVLFGLTVKPSVALPLPDELSSTIQLTSLVAVHPHVPDGRLIVRLDCVPA